MSKILRILKLGFTIFFLTLVHNSSFAQLPQCSLVYFDQYFLFGSTGDIYTYNPALPASPTNPSLNSIQIPLGGVTFGLAVSEILGSGDPTLTFYTVKNNQYWYYNPVTSAWINTNHFTGSSGTAFNIASGGGYIYNLSGGDGKVYVYDGTGNGTFLITIPDFIGEGPYDLIADCEGNFYVLNVTGMNATPFLRKYNHSGALLNSWTINNPNNYFLGNGNGHTAGFGIIDTTIYVDNIDSNGVKTIVSGTLNTTTVDFTGISTPVVIPFLAGFYAGDFATCASSVSATPQITITASATTVPPGTSVTFTSNINNGGTNPQYQWYVNGIAISGATNSTYTYMPEPNDVITCELTSSLPCITAPSANSNAITIYGCPPIKLDYASSLYCQTNGIDIPDFSPPGGFFSASPAGLNINSNTGAIDLGASGLGTYVITYSISETPDCPAKSIQDTVTIAQPPVAAIDLKDSLLCVNELVTLSTPADLSYSYKWSPQEYFPFGDSMATVTAKIIGSRTIYVNVARTNGCHAIDSLILNPETCCGVMMPSAFSPNGDGLNDIFKIYSNTNQKITSFSVYNRFGQRMFFSIDQNLGWDGTYKNESADAGVYYYYLSYICSNGEHFVKKGDVSLIR